MSVAALSAPPAPATKPGIGFDMQVAGGGMAAPSFRGRMSPYGLPEQPDATAFEIVQPLHCNEPAAAPPAPVLEPEPQEDAESVIDEPQIAVQSIPEIQTQKEAQPEPQHVPQIEAQSEPQPEPEVQPQFGSQPETPAEWPEELSEPQAETFVPEPEPEHDTIVIQSASAQPLAARARPKPMGITVKRAAPLAMPRDTPLWADIAPHVEAMLDTLPQAQPFAASVDSARFAALPLDGTVQCYIGSVIVGGIKVLLQAVPTRPLHRPAGFDHTLVSRDGESFWVRYEIES